LGLTKCAFSQFHEKHVAAKDDELRSRKNQEKKYHSENWYESPNPNRAQHLFSTIIYVVGSMIDHSVKHNYLAKIKNTSNFEASLISFSKMSAVIIM